jgi:signal transduction histidine kinase
VERYPAMAAPGFPLLVSLACHDLRTPLATISGFAKTLARDGELPERQKRFIELIDAAADQMTELLELLGLAARIESGRYEPALAEVDTLVLATAADDHVAARGEGEQVETDPAAVRLSLRALAVAAARHGGVPQTVWTVSGRRLVLSPLTDGAARVVRGEEAKDLGALVAGRVLARLGASVAVEGGALVVQL